MTGARARAAILQALADGKHKISASPTDFRLRLAEFPDLAIAQPGERFDFVICVRCDDAHPLLLLDNLIGDCGRCGSRVQFRPDAPDFPKLCLDCFAREVE
jgi:hypothetical protein